MSFSPTLFGQLLCKEPLWRNGSGQSRLVLRPAPNRRRERRKRSSARKAADSVHALCRRPEENHDRDSNPLHNREAGTDTRNGLGTPHPPLDFLHR